MTEVIDVEVLPAETFRTRVRNAARTPDVLPPDVDTKVGSISRLDTPEMQTRAVTTMLNHARTGLLAAIAAQDLPEIAKFKQKSAAIQEIAKQVRLGKDMQLDAAEFVRRAERGLGVAIREGQERGTVETKSDASRRGTVIREMNQGRRHSSDGDLLDGKVRPTDLAPVGELHGARTGEGIYAMTDNVSDEQFEEALAEAREEGNLSRANVARKAKAKAQQKEPADVKPAPLPPAQEWPFKNTPTEFLAEITGSIAAFAENIKWVTAGSVEADELESLTKQARDSWSRINKHLKRIQNGQA